MLDTENIKALAEILINLKNYSDLLLDIPDSDPDMLTSMRRLVK